MPTPAQTQLERDIIALNFNPENATVERIDNNLVFTLNDGTTTIFEDFFVTEGKALPLLTLPDGTQVDSETLLAQLNADMDLSTAAGPAAAPDSGGTNYSDDAGQLIDGVAYSDALGTDYWQRTANALQLDNTLTAALDGESTLPLPPTDPGTPTPEPTTP